jgi:hypothetical protein
MSTEQVASAVSHVCCVQGVVLLIPSGGRDSDREAISNGYQPRSLLTTNPYVMMTPFVHCDAASNDRVLMSRNLD